LKKIIEKIKKSIEKNITKRKHRESIRDMIVANYLYVVNSIQILWFKKEKKNIILNDYELTFKDDFKEFNSDIWRIGHSWGVIHPELSYLYYGEESVKNDERGLILEQKYYPRTNINDWYNTNIFFNPKWSVGLVTSKKSFDYGVFDFEVTMPKGSGLWPAIWFVSDTSYPPEIDLVEGYSDINGLYKNKMNTNCHFNFKPTQKESIARNNYIKDVDKKSNKIRFTLIWEENFIKMYYNGFLVRYITDKKTIKWFQNHKMIIILNNAIRQYFDDLVDINQTSEFIIHNVKYYSKKK